jgi:23S rRNA pseudouridine1911/1915/1917 synthase
MMSEQKPGVVYEDDCLMVLNKPSGWVVNDAQTVKTPTVQQFISNNFKSILSKNTNLRSGIVHRLDKETSGCLLVAKDEDTFYELQSLFKERKIKKTYIALLHGKLIGEGEIKTPLGRLPWNRERFGILPGGREAVTNYSVVKNYKKDDQFFSLVEFNPLTGRTHQIRIHAKHLGHAIVSDNFYAGRKTSRKDRLWCKRLFLHAKSVSFELYGKKYDIDCALGNDLKEAMAGLDEV